MNRFNFVLKACILAGAWNSLMFAQDNGFGSIPDETKPQLKSTYTIDSSASADSSSIINKTLTSSDKDESVLLVKDKKEAFASDSSFIKQNGNTSNEGQSNFYGLNAAVTVQDSAVLTLKNVKINTNADGSNAVFCTGNDSLISIDGITISTESDSSRGLDATYSGVITANNVDITTKGSHCAAFATDRGEGTVTVKNGKVNTNGEGSPVIYSTGNISVTNIQGKAENSEIAVIEGKNSITIDSSTLSGNGNSGIMLYQSMSGDANIGESILNVQKSVLNNLSSTPFFYITNTNSVINITDTQINNKSANLIKVSGNNSERGWGRKGSNGGTLTFNASKMNLSGTITTDIISELNLNFKDNTTFKGCINSCNQGTVNLSIDKTSSITLTGNSYVNALSSKNLKFSNISSNGYNLYYNKDCESNKYLKGKTITLKDGGKILPGSINLKTEKTECPMNNKEHPFPKDMNGMPPEMENDNSKMPFGNNNNRGPEMEMKSESITGTIKIFGTAPNTFAGFVTDDGKEYTIMDPSKMGPRGKKGDDKGPNPPKDMDKMPPKDNVSKNNPMPKAMELKDLIGLVGEKITITCNIMPQMGFAPPGEDENKKINKDFNTLKDGMIMIMSYKKE